MPPDQQLNISFNKKGHLINLAIKYPRYGLKCAIQFRIERIDTRKLGTKSQQKFRNQATRLRKTGRKYREIDEIIGVHETAVCKWHRVYLQDGRSAVTEKQRDRPTGSCHTLTQEQEKELQRAIRD